MARERELTITEHTTSGEALQLAMKREQAAHDFYKQCAGIAGDPGVRQLFEFLAREETRHLELLEKEYDRFVAKEN